MSPLKSKKATNFTKRKAKVTVTSLGKNLLFFGQKKQREKIVVTETIIIIIITNKNRRIPIQLSNLKMKISFEIMVLQPVAFAWVD